MGLRFRKSMNFGPFRINLSKSGVGYSVGGKGFRWTKKAGGGTRTTASIPGTGISYVKDSKGGKEKKTNPILMALGLFVVVCLVLGFLGGMISVLTGCSADAPAASPSATVEASLVPSPVVSASPEQSPKPSESVKPSETPKPSESVKPSATPAASAAPSPSASAAPSVAPSPTPTVTPSASPSVEPSPVETPAPSASAAPSEAPSPSVSVAPSVAPSPSATPKPSPSAIPTPSASAVVPSQPEKDEITYIGNSNTLKFHKQTCSSVDDMKEEHKVAITGKDNAVAQGYSPCGRCKP